MVSPAGSIFFRPEPRSAAMCLRRAMDSRETPRMSTKAIPARRRIGATQRAKARHARSLTGGNHLRASGKTTAPGR